MKTTGSVSLVGAGPGDPELLTLRGAKRLSRADLVLYDALVEPAALAHAPTAHTFFVGKRAGQRAISQRTIERLMIRAAKRGRRVVRLKCGDPFVLGRGGEEALALARAGVPFEVVPGISAAVAAPASAGIPVTQRGTSSGFAVISGHSPERIATLVGAIAPGSLTLVVLMGLRTRQALARTLLAAKWRRDTPVAVVLGATTARGGGWTGRLAELARLDTDELGGDAPGTIIVGEVVRLADRLGPEWLFGRRDATDGASEALSNETTARARLGAGGLT